MKDVSNWRFSSTYMETERFSGDGVNLSVVISTDLLWSGKIIANLQTGK